MGGVAETMTAPSRVLVATQHALLGESLAMLLAQDERLAATCLPPLSSADGADAERSPADILLLDTSFEPAAAAEICRRLRRASPDAVVVLLDGDDPHGSTRRAADLGAVGILSTRTPGPALPEALLRASGGARVTVSRRQDRHECTREQLTERERQVLGALGSGRSVDQIAADLEISPHTVRTHIENGMARLGAGSRLEAVALMRRTDADGPGDPDTSSTLAVGTAADGAGQPTLATARVVLAAEPTIFRDAMRVALEQMPNVVVVAEATTTGELEQLLFDGGWNIAVVDESVRGGLISACALVKSFDDPPRVLVTSRSPDQTVLLSAVEAGADGYLTRGAGLVQLAEAIERVRNGEASIPPRMLGALLRNLIDRRREEDEAVERLASLTKRERTVLGLLVEGLDQEQIARRLVVSPHTARTHVQNVLRKLHVHSRLEAVALVTTHNLHERFELKAQAGRS